MPMYKRYYNIFTVYCTKTHRQQTVRACHGLGRLWVKQYSYKLVRFSSGILTMRLEASHLKKKALTSLPVTDIQNDIQVFYLWDLNVVFGTPLLL